LQTVGSVYRGPYDVFRQSWKQPGGIRSLYRGIGTVLLGGTPGTMIYLCSYEWTKDYFGRIQQQSFQTATHSQNGENQQNEPSLYIHLLAGMVAETLACLIYVPVDVLKERMQVSSAYQNAYHGLQILTKNEGVIGLYRGYWATLASFGPFSALYFMSYEQCQRWERTRLYGTGPIRDLPLLSVVACSCTAGAFASWITSPLDMAKLRLQVEERTNSSTLSSSSSTATTKSITSMQTKQSSMRKILIQVLQTDGITGLFRGAGARVLHFAPATTITISCYEMCRTFLSQHV
jgi:Mitochondrial carrier protein